MRNGVPLRRAETSSRAGCGGDAVFDLPEIPGVRIRGRAWLAIRRAVLTDEPRCRLCREKGKTVRAVEVDHIRPLHKGGDNSRENLQPLCRPCHRAKTSPRPAIGVDGWPIAREGTR
jgi:5-methylcytosine-specific restriction protein A